MNKDELVKVLTALSIGLSQVSEIENNKEFTLIAESMDLVIDKIAEKGADKVIGGIKTTAKFEYNCEIYIDNTIDQWIFTYKDEILEISKSKFECLLAKKELQKKLNL